MSVTLAVRFPLGRYHATAWDRSVNEGAVEWPPAPWRLLRALVATWYTRWPELPAPALDSLLEALGDPPSYWTSPARPAHTRHYLPDADHKKGETGGTDLTLDPYLSLPPSGHHLLIRWDAALTGEQRGVLAKLVELVPYLGRAESVCDVRLLDDDPEPDETWWRPTVAGSESARLLAPRRPISRPALELTTVKVRKDRRTLPPDTMWVHYGRTPADPPAATASRRPNADVTAIRFGVASKAPFKASHGVLLADRVHRMVTHRLDGGRPELLGHRGASTNHAHAHWIPVASGFERGATVDALVVWVPATLTPEEVAAIIGVHTVSGRRGGGPDSNGYDVKGFPESRLLLQAVGTVEQVAPELCRPARVWRSLTPYLPVRHRKREPLHDYLAADIRRELSYRDRTSSDVAVACIGPEGRLSDRWALEFRRYREQEGLEHSRPGLGLRLTFAEAVPGPLLLGQLSHFGYGIFVPDREAGP
jgi:CRISPR-associated protein Csb2